MRLDDTFLLIDAKPPRQRVARVRLAAMEPRSFVAGPGERAVIWVAGCLRRCPNCMKPDLFSFKAGTTVSVASLARQIFAIPRLDGVTFSGGEPFEQAVALGALAKRLKASGLTIAAYAGYRLDALQRESRRFGALLDQVDLLIDGEYREELPGPFPWFGSANQRIHNLRTHTSNALSSHTAVRQVQLTVHGGGLRMTGFPNNALERDLRNALRRKGIVMGSVR